MNSVWGFMLLGVLTGSSNGIAKVLLPLFALHLQADAWQVGLVGGLQFAGVLLLAMPLAGLIELYGSRRLFTLGGMGGALLFAVGFSSAEQTWQLILGVVLLGLLNPLRVVTVQIEFLRLLPTWGRHRAGWQRAAHVAGLFFLGPMLGAALLGVCGYSDTFSWVAVGILCAVLLGQRVLLGQPTQPETRSLWEHVKRQLHLVRERSALRHSLLIELAGQTAMSYFTVFIIVAAVQRFELSVQQAAGLVSLQGALFVLMLLIGGQRWLSVSAEQNYQRAFLLLLVAQLFLAEPGSVYGLWLGAALLGLGLGLQHLTSVTRFAELTQEFGRGVGGLFSLAGPAGNLLGAIAGGLVVQHWGVFAGFHGLLLLYLGLLAWQHYQLWQQHATCSG